MRVTDPRPGPGLMWHPGIILCFALATVCLSGNAIGGDTVVVELQSGQRLRADTIERDPITPGRAILTVGSGQIQIRRGVSWNRVSRLAAPPAMLIDLQVPANIKVVDPAANPQRIELNLIPGPEQADQNTAQLRSFFRFAPPPPAPDDAPLEFPIDRAVLIDGPTVVPSLRRRDRSGSPVNLNPAWHIPACVVLRDPGVVLGIRNADPSAPPPRPVTGTMTEVPQPRELVVAARAFNRNGLADWNSLEVSAQGRTAAGLPCRVRGSLKCSLWVRRARLVRMYAETYFEEPLDLVMLGQWSQFLDGSETDAYGVQKLVLALPPRSPDHNLTLGDFGLLTVDLDIPGQGRLATSSEAIPLRQTGPNRSRSVIDFGSSLLPSESVSEGVNAAGHWTAPLSGLRPDSRRFTVQP